MPVIDLINTSGSYEYMVSDVSRFNTIKNYTSFAKEVDGVIIRIGYRGYGAAGNLMVDNKFETHWKGFKAAISKAGKNSTNFKMGIYFFSQALNNIEADQEVDFVITYVNQIIGKIEDLDFPIYIDSELANSGAGRADMLDPTTRTDMIIRFAQIMKARCPSVRVGVYASDSWFKNNLQQSRLISAGVTNFWVARYSNSRPANVDNYDGWQYTSSATVSGGTGSFDMSEFRRSAANWNSSTGGLIVPTVYYNLTDTPIKLSFTTVEYNDGNPIEPAVSLPAYPELVAGFDFDVEYKDNVYPGTAKVIIKGRANKYIIGRSETTFTITKKSMSGCRIVFTSDMNKIIYTGLAVCPDFYVAGVTQLIIPTDLYSPKFTNNINAGLNTAKLTVTFDSRLYSGSISANFTIWQASIINKDVIFDKPMYKYTGEEIKPKVSIIGLKEGVDFTVSYKNNINLGKGEVLIYGKGNYTNIKRATFIIDKMILTGRRVSVLPVSYIYDSTPKIPTRVSVEGLDSRDFTYTVENNVDVGTATVTCTGRGDWTESTTGTFKILPKDIGPYKVELEENIYMYTSGNITPEIKVEKLEKDIDYKIEYLNCKDLGQARIAVSGINNYTGTKYLDFTIVERPITDCIGKYGEATIRSIYRVNNNTFKLYADGVELSEEHYNITDINSDEFTDEDGIDFSLITLEVKGLNGITGEAIFRFRVIEKEPDTPIDYEDDGVYNFGDIDLGDETAVGNYDFYSLDGDNYYKSETPPEEENPDEEDTDVDAGDIDEQSESQPDTVEVLEELYDPIEWETEPSVVIDEQDYDFDELAGGIFIAMHDEDTGFNIDSKGRYSDEYHKEDFKEDDGTYNFGDIDEGDETAIGDYDFGDLDEGVADDTMAKDGENYDFNKFAGDIEEGFYPGTEYELKDTPIYATHCSLLSARLGNGTHFIYDSDIKNSRIRVCKHSIDIEEAGGSAGWVKTIDLLNLGQLAVGTQVAVNGKAYKYSNGAGGYVEYIDTIFYICEILDPELYQYCYGIATQPNNTRLGWVEKDALSRVEDL